MTLTAGGVCMVMGMVVVVHLIQYKSLVGYSIG